VSQDDHDVGQSKRNRHGDEHVDGSDADCPVAQGATPCGEGVPTRRTMYLASITWLCSIPSFNGSL